MPISTYLLTESSISFAGFDMFQRCFQGAGHPIVLHVFIRRFSHHLQSFITSQVVPNFRASTAWISNFNLLSWVNGIIFQQPKLYLAHVTSCDLNSFRISESHFMGINMVEKSTAQKGWVQSSQKTGTWWTSPFAIPYTSKTHRKASRCLKLGTTLSSPLPFS